MSKSPTYGVPAAERFNLTAFTEGVKSNLIEKQVAYADKDLVETMIGLEGFRVNLDEADSHLNSSDHAKFVAQTSALSVAASEVDEFLNEHHVREYLSELRGHEDNMNHPVVEAGMEAARLTLMMGGDPEVYNHKFLRKTGDGLASEIRVLSPDKRGEFDPLTSEYSLESFDGLKLQDWVGTSALANAIVATAGAAAESFFTTKVLPASQNGAYIDVTYPVVYNRVARNTDGTRYDLAKKSAVRAMVDYTILNSNANKVYPIATTDKAGVLVDAGTIANENVSIAGVSTAIRPILYGTEVDLIAISATDAMLQAGSMDATDTLDPVIAIGVQYFSLVSTPDATELTSYFKVDTKDMVGSWLQPSQDGDARVLNGSFNAEITVRSTDTDIAGNALATRFTNIATAAGVAGAYRLGITLEISSHVNLTTSNMKASLNGITLTSIYDETTGDKIDDDTLATVNAAIALAGVGWYPDARRSNTNMSIDTDIVDLSDTFRALIPARMRAPFTLVNPPSVPGNGLTLRALQMMSSIRSSNEAVTRIEEAASTISAASGDIAGTMMVGTRAGIVPTYITREVNVMERVSQNRTDLAMPSLQNWLSYVVTMLGQDLLIKSDYLASLEAFTGSQQNYKFILLTDPRIYSLLMITGENRTLGLGQKFEISPSVDERVKNVIWMSVKRTDTNELNPHSFGGHTVMPSMVHQAVVTGSGNHVANKTIYVPRYDYAVLCPILGKITVEGLDTLYMEAAA